MDYFKAEAIVKEEGLYFSPDFYRMIKSDTIALALRDTPLHILMDVSFYGTEEARATLQGAIEQGLVIKSEPEPGVTTYDIMDLEDTGGDPYFLSHLAMQIAYPSLYKEYFDGDLVWSFYDPRMRELLGLCVSCLTNRLHPSDYFGRHEIGSKNPAGRPKSKPKELNMSHREWVTACQEYKIELSKLWDDYKAACAHRKANLVQADKWLKEEMSKLKHSYEQGIAQLDNNVSAAQDAHSQLKAEGKPKRANYE